MAAPPLRLADEAVRLALGSPATTVLFVPRWEKQHWWRRLQSASERWIEFGRWPAAQAERWAGSELEGNDAWELVGLRVWGTTNEA